MIRYAAVMIAALVMLVLSCQARAIPVTEAPPGLLAVGTIVAPGIEIKGYEMVTKRYWQIHGRDRKFVWEPILGATAPVPDANVYMMMLAGLGLVIYRVKRKK